ncbi:MAG: hypothetical protein ABR905_02945 [Terracidiphilus sp.]|jgi:hypothetical protein
MRVDADSTNTNPVNPYNAAAEKTSAARRSFQMRKKLAKRAASGQGWAGLDQAAMIGQWMSGGQGLTINKDQRNPDTSKV